MSDTEQMVRVMEHAAELMRGRIEILTGRGLDNSVGVDDVRDVAALAYGRAVLRMVAASVAPEGRGRTIELVDKLTSGYAEWAEANDGVLMADGELTSVARYLKSTIGGTS